MITHPFSVTGMTCGSRPGAVTSEGTLDAATVGRWSRAVAILVLILLATVGCGPEPDTTPAKPFNEADTTFVLEAGSHLGKTVTAARTATERATDPRVRQLARTIVETQAPHADSIAAWLSSWGKQGAPFDHGDVPHDDAPTTGAGFTNEALGRLTTIPPKQFDQLFTKLLVEHLKLGRGIFKTEVSDGQNPGAKRLARQALKQQSELQRAASRFG